MKNNALDQLEEEFLAGDLYRLRMRECPVCGRLGLLFSVAKIPVDLAAPPGRRYRAGISIYCRNECNSMISHMDGFCPAWAENIEDWAIFSDDLLR